MRDGTRGMKCQMCTTMDKALYMGLACKALSEELAEVQTIAQHSKRNATLL
jgi:hypothetical protein